jgi:hypothetical protein
MHRTRSRKLLARSICSRAVIADPNMFTGVQHHMMADGIQLRWRLSKWVPVIKIEWLRAQRTGTANRNKLASGLGLLRFRDVAEVESNKKENEVNGRTYGTKLGRLNKARADKRHRNAHNGKIELDSRAHEKRARQELSEISASDSKINRHSSPDDDCSNKY